MTRRASRSSSTSAISRRVRQHGAALYVAMMLIVMLLLLAVAGMRAVTLEARVTANMLQHQRLREAADGVLREGERVIQKHGLPLAPCGTASSPYEEGRAPCFISEAKTDAVGLGTNFSVNAKANGLAGSGGHWYPRLVEMKCPIGKGPTAALDAADTGCTAFYELNAQAHADDDQARDCGPEALCLRSTVNLFIK